MNRLLDPTIGIEFDAVARRPTQTDRKQHPQIAPPGFLPNRFQRSLPEHMPFEFTHGPLQAQEQPIIHEDGIVHAIRINHDRADHAAQFDQVMPIPAIACESRGLDAQYRTDFSRTHLGDQLLEPWPFDQARTRTPEIIINDQNVGEAQLARAISQRVLAALAFLVVHHLAG